MRTYIVVREDCDRVGPLSPLTTDIYQSESLLTLLRDIAPIVDISDDEFMNEFHFRNDDDMLHVYELYNGQLTEDLVSPYGDKPILYIERVMDENYVGPFPDLKQALTHREMMRRRGDPTLGKLVTCVIYGTVVTPNDDEGLDDTDLEPVCVCPISPCPKHSGTYSHEKAKPFGS